jgi:signal transduction histidine kinase
MFLLDMMDGLVDLAQIEAGKVAVEEQVVAVAEVVQPAIAAILPIAQGKSINVNCDLGRGATLPIRVDRSKFERIMINLLSNSVKFTEPRGDIVIGSVLDCHGDLLISIGDTGIGIAPEHLQKVLEPFARVLDHLIRENEGIGLGLPIAKALIELHGGELLLSSALGAGTIVALRLPRERIHCDASAMSG